MHSRLIHSDSGISPILQHNLCARIRLGECKLKRSKKLPPHLIATKGVVG